MKTFVKNSEIRVSSIYDLPNAGQSWRDTKFATIHFVECLGIKNPRILDLGIGRGELGFMIKEHGIEASITGIEICESDLTDESCSSYDEVFIADVTKDLTPEFLSGFDFVVWLDVIEHLEIEEAARVATMIVQNSQLSIISTPNFKMTQKGDSNNPFEEHKCYLDFHSMKSLNPISAHLTDYGAATYFFEKNQADAEFVNSRVSVSKIPDHLKSLGVDKSGLYEVNSDKSLSLVFTTRNMKFNRRKRISEWYG